MRPMLERDSTEAAIFKQSSAVGISSLSVWKSLHSNVKIPLEPVSRFSTMSTLLCSSWKHDNTFLFISCILFYFVVVNSTLAASQIALLSSRKVLVLEDTQGPCPRTSSPCSCPRTKSPCPWSTKSLKIINDFAFCNHYYVWSGDVHKYGYRHHAWGYSVEKLAYWYQYVSHSFL